MAAIVSTIVSDFRGLGRACGWGTATRWLTMIGWNWRQCLRRHDLQPADIAMGDGPFLVRRGRACAKLAGDHVVTGIREIWVRDNYLGGSFLSIKPGALV